MAEITGSGTCQFLSSQKGAVPDWYLGEPLRECQCTLERLERKELALVRGVRQSILLFGEALHIALRKTVQ